MNKRQFKWDFKENMTQEEITEVLNQHTSFLGVEKMEALNKELKDSLDKANQELAPIKEDAKRQRYSNLLPKNANKELIKDIIALSNLNEDMDDNSIKEAFKNTIKERDYLQNKISTTEPKIEKTSIFGKTEKPAEAGTSNLFE